MSREYVSHGDIVRFADARVNLKREDASELRAQANRLRDKLETYLSDHPDFGLKKMLLSGSLAKGTALKSVSDIDVACYVASESAPHAVGELIEWLAKRLESAFLLSEVLPADLHLPIAIRSFLGPASDLTGALPENTLLLTDAFRQRYLEDGQSWQSDIRPRVEAFLTAAAKQSRQLRLILDAHASIAFLAGMVLDVKSGVDVNLIQKGRVGARMWRADDGSTGARFAERVLPLGTGRDIVVLMSAAQIAPAPRSRSRMARLSSRTSSLVWVSMIRLAFGAAIRS